MNRSRSLSLAVMFLAATLAVAPHPAWSAWPHSPNVNLPMCAATGDQQYPLIVSDGAGGGIIVWIDQRSGSNSDIYAQRVDASGNVKWTVNGVPICTVAQDQTGPQITADGAGGAIIAWEDNRNGNYDIYAQRVNAAGAVQWTVNGVAICAAALGQRYPQIVSDGSGGAIIAWQDNRTAADWDVYAQRVNGSGIAQWTANGVAICTAARDQQELQLTTDGAGGVILTWLDYRSTTNWHVYAQRVNAAGSWTWTANGVALCTAANNQDTPQIVSDGSGGAIVAWLDTRTSLTAAIYAQRVLASGAVGWFDGGEALTTGALNSQSHPRMVSDAAGGAIVTWIDSGTLFHLYAQHMLSSGIKDPNWPAAGRAVCMGGDVWAPAIASDGAGGAIVTWSDDRGEVTDVYAHHVLASGAVDPVWTVDGRPLGRLGGYPAIVPDGTGGAIVTWYGTTTPAAPSWDIYAQRVERYGQLGNPEPVSAGVRDVPNDQGGRVKLSWYASYLDADPLNNIGSYWIWRSVPPNVARAALRAGARMLAQDESMILDRTRTFTTSIEAGQTVFWEYVGSQVADQLPGYSYVTSTTSDSVGGSNPRTLFMVEARATSGSAHWASAPDSGYSVDNLAPSAPAPFTGQYSGGTATLHWAVNPAADLAEYRLYRGNTAGFVPGPGNLVVAQSDTGYVDAAGAPYYYKLCAVDVHGNASGFSTLLPSGTVDVPGVALPRTMFLAPPAPNPARGATTLRFGLPRPARVELALYDQQGRRVRSLLSGTQPAGERTITWDGRDESGRALPAGLYFVRLATEGRTFVSRLAVIR